MPPQAASPSLDRFYINLQNAILVLEAVTHAPAGSHHYSVAKEAVQNAEHAWRVLLNGEWEGIRRRTMVYPGLFNAFSADQFAPLVRALDVRSVRDFEARLKADSARLKACVRKVPKAPNLIHDFKMPDFDAHLPALSAFSTAIAEYKQTLAPEMRTESSAQEGWATRICERVGRLGGWSKG